MSRFKLLFLFTTLSILTPDGQDITGGDGSFPSMIDGDRYSEVVQKLYSPPPDPPTLYFISDSWRGHCILRSVSIPKPSRAAKYVTAERVMLCFYTGMPFISPGEKTSISLLVEIGDRREYTVDNLEPEWRLRIVDLGLYAGTQQDISFRLYDTKRLLEEHASLRPVTIALPRIVACHGPYYIGYGGGMSPGRHGKNKVVGRSKLDNPLPKIDRTIIPHPLMIRWYDFVQPSTLELETKSRNVTYTLGQGIHWLPIKIYDDKQEHTLISGEVESGAIDIIPDFTVGDEEYLPAIK